MLTTKRFEYLEFGKIQIHPTVGNHRKVEPSKVKHYEEDILKNGLLEPLVIWEKNHNEYYLVGGFHRHGAICRIREKNPGYFDRVDVRVVGGNPDEIRALNLKLNADRVDTKVSDYFDTVIYLNNVNWETSRIAEFLDKSESWVEEIIRLVPVMSQELRRLVDEEKVSWNKAKAICRDVIKAPAGEENAVMQQAVERLENPQKQMAPKKPLNFRTVKSRLSKGVKKQETQSYTLNHSELLSFVKVLEGKTYEEADLATVKTKFPGILPEDEANDKDEANGEAEDSPEAAKPEQASPPSEGPSGQAAPAQEGWDILSN